jgi:hypothetical protein
MNAFWKSIWSLALCLLVSKAAGVQMIEAEAKTGEPWGPQATRTLDDLPPLPADAGLDRFGGLTARNEQATGFFHTAKIQGRWWLVDPEGGLFLNAGVASVKMIPTAGARAALEAKFGTESNWAAATAGMLREHGFNGMGAWSDLAVLRNTSPPLVYTTLLDFMGSFGKKHGGTYQQVGHLGYSNDCMYIFDPAFETYCDDYAKPLAAFKDDPWLLGYFSDNELPFKPGALSNYLNLPPGDPGHIAAWNFLQARHGQKAVLADVTESDRAGFLALVAERYFRAVSTAIKKYDPNHLYLGPRLHGMELLRSRPFFAAIGPFVDVVSVNYYRVWSPSTQPKMWEKESGRPVLITEWYAKGEDSGMANTTGAGWLVKTQPERGLFYQNFALGLLESKVCVGWHWFRYSDNDSTDKSVDPSNRDSNKGIVNNRYEPYGPLLESMEQLNTRIYSLVDYFDRVRVTAAGGGHHPGGSPGE